MHRIDDPTASPTLPAPRPQGTPGYFTGGSPGSGGFAATVVRYEFLNAVQEELSAIAQAAGLALDKTNNSQVLAALRQMLRFKLSQDETFYISPTGNDANDGLTPATALRTGQAAWDQALVIDLNNHNLFLQFADGTYTTPINCAGRPLGLGAESGIIITGNLAQPSQVIFSTTNVACISASQGASVNVQGVTLTSTGIPGQYQSMGTGLFAWIDGVIGFDNVVFGHCDFAHVNAAAGIIETGGAPYAIAGGSTYHATATGGGLIMIVNSAVTITGTPAFTGTFAMAAGHGIVSAGGCAFAGAATGPRYYVASGGLVDTNGGGANFLPGNAAGTAVAASYGVYN